MSLMRLLNSSGSLNPAANAPHRYKMSAPIPKFVPAKQPATLAPAKVERKKERDMQTESLFEASKPAVSEAAQNFADVPGVLSVGVFPKTPAPFAPVVPKQTWFQKLKSLFTRKPSALEAKPVQTEWSLDRVTVVRNDLSDTDFEVVVAKSGVVAEKAKGKSLVGRAWKRTEVSVANPEPVDTLK